MGRSLAYVSREKALLKDAQGNPLIITHNLTATSLQGIQQEFQVNEMRRLHRRSNNNQVLHTILSFSPEDTERLDAATLEALTRSYIELYNPNSLYYATVHQDKRHTHVHIIASGVDMTGYANRVDKTGFERIKEELQRIQQEQYPDLGASIVNHGAHEKGEGHTGKDEKGAKKKLRKEELKQIVAASFDLAQSKEEFYALLKGEGLNTYQRGNSVVGIADERNFRFSTLGFDVNELDQRENRLKELEELSVETDEERVRESKPVEEQSEEERRLGELDNLYGR